MFTELQTNYNIDFDTVLIVDEDGKQLGIMSRNKGVMLAKEKDMDLVCVSPTAKNPVCKIMDYGKYRFSQQKKEKENRKSHSSSSFSEVQFSYATQLHDLEIKVATAKRLIEKGNTVQLMLKLRGREIGLADIAQEKMQKVVDMCSDFAKVKKPINLDGRDVKVVLEKK